jgi:hypothetical protein
MPDTAPETGVSPLGRISQSVGAIWKQARTKMDRITWLKEMRRDCEEQYDTRWAPLYGEKWGLYGNTTHQQFI